MKKREFLTLFSGGGLFTKGAIEAGLDPIGAIDNDARKAELYKLNHGSLIDVRDIRQIFMCEWEKYKGCWLVQASPPCKNSSKSKRHESAEAKEEASDLDLDLAKAVSRALHIIRPKHFILENVCDYAATPAYKDILANLKRLGYSWRQYKLNSADFGVPQSRDRLYLVASQNYKITSEFLDFSPYLLPRVGWYSALERHLGTCKKKILAPYQVKAITRAIEKGKIALDDIAVLVGGAGSNPNKPGVTHYAAPSPTVRSCEGLRSGGWRPCIVKASEFLKPQGEAIGYKLSSRCLLALQGVPDSYQVGNEVVTGFVAGNGVSVPVARALCSALVQVEKRTNS